MPAREPVKPTEAQLRAWISRSWTLLLEGETWTVTAEKADQFELLWGPCVQAIRYATAWVALSSTEHARESDVLARSALEHAATAQWCYFTDDGVQRLRVKVEREYHSYFSQMAEWKGYDEIKADLARRTPPAPSEQSMPNFSSKIVPMLDADHLLEMSYRTLSRRVHVTDGTVLSFLVQDGDTNTVTATPRATDQFSAAFVAATSAMLALAVIADHLDSDDLLRDLNQTSNDLQLPMFLDQDRNRRMRDQYDTPTPAR